MLLVVVVVVVVVVVAAASNDNGSGSGSSSSSSASKGRSKHEKDFVFSKLAKPVRCMPESLGHQDLELRLIEFIRVMNSPAIS